MCLVFKSKISSLPSFTKLCSINNNLVKMSMLMIAPLINCVNFYRLHHKISVSKLIYTYFLISYAKTRRNVSVCQSYRTGFQVLHRNWEANSKERVLQWQMQRNLESRRVVRGKLLALILKNSSGLGDLTCLRPGLQMWLKLHIIKEKTLTAQ